MRYFLLFAFYITSSYGYVAQAQCSLIESYKNMRPTKKYFYSNGGQLAKEEDFKKGELANKKRFFYNKERKLDHVEVSKVKSDIVKMYYYFYDNKGRLIRKSIQINSEEIEEVRFVYKKNKLTERHRKVKNKKGVFKQSISFFIWANGNIVQSKTFRKEKSELDHRKTSTYNYDTKQNPYYQRGDKVKNISKNNIVQKNVRDRFGVQIVKDSYTATIKYNNNDYPKSISRVYSSGKQSSREFKYDCK